MKWERETWRKLYCRESLDQRRWPLFARGLRDYLFRHADDDGVLLRRSADPAGDLAYALGASGTCPGASGTVPGLSRDVSWTETDMVRDAVRLMLDDGFLELGTDGQLTIRNFWAAQTKRSYEAVRKAAYRHRKRQESLQAQLPGIASAAAAPEQAATARQSRDMSPDQIRSEKIREESESAPAHTPTRVLQDEEQEQQTCHCDPEPPEVLPPEAERSLEEDAPPAGESSYDLAKRIWLEEYERRHGIAYALSPNLGPKSEHLTLKWLGDLARERGGTRDAERWVRHWARGFLAERGKCAEARHPLKWLEQAVNSLGPLPKRSPVPGTGMPAIKLPPHELRWRAAADEMGEGVDQSAKIGFGGAGPAPFGNPSQPDGARGPVKVATRPEPETRIAASGGG